MGTVGKRIYNPMELIGIKSVYVKRWNRPCAVAFLLSMQFRVLAEYMDYGIFEYTPEQKTKGSFTDIF